MKRSLIGTLLFLSCGFSIAFAQVPINVIESGQPASYAAKPPVTHTTKTAVAPLESTPTPTPTPIPTPTPQPTIAPTVAPKTVPSSHTEQMALAGIPEGDWEFVEWIIRKESGWRHDVWNSTGSGAYGVCQALPASKMASAGADYMTNPITQLRWCHSYALSRYGGWYEAFIAWGRQGWW